MPRRATLLAFSASVFVGLGACSDQGPQIEDVVMVSGGPVRARAVDGNTVRVWEEIPYAAAPVEDLRWRPPARPASWDTVRDAPAESVRCIQTKGPGSFYGRPIAGPRDEDCLYLNVWSAARSPDEARPVMVWIHGGALVTGSGAAYDGRVLAEKGVVLVTINYRLGPFGFVAHPGLSAESDHAASGNYGFLDQIAALEWVRDNVGSFGGDPGRVTIFGESAGSLSVNVLQASPLARGLFHGVIGESGGAFHPMTYLREDKPWSDAGESSGVALAEALGAEGSSDDEIVASLRELPADEVLSKWRGDPTLSNYWALPQVDGYVLPDEVAQIYEEGRQTDVPVMIGSNADEGTALTDAVWPEFDLDTHRDWVKSSHPDLASEVHDLYPASNDEEAWQAQADLIGDEWFTYHMRQWARDMDKVSSDAYLYFFTYAPPIEKRDRYGAFHAAEIAYVFGKLNGFDAKPGPADESLSDVLSSAWVRFATTFDPNGPGLEKWEAFRSSNEAYIEFGGTVAAKTRLRMEKVDIIRRSFDARRKGGKGSTVIDTTSE